MTISSENHVKVKAGPVAIPHRVFFYKPYGPFGLCYCSHLAGIYAVKVCFFMKQAYPKLNF